MRRLRAVLRWIVEGLAADHTWCWGYGFPPHALHQAQNSSRSSRSTPRSAS